MPKPSVLIVTGLAGSGKTVALRALEDSGTACVDNLPPRLIDAFVSAISEEKGGTGKARVAVGIDIRERGFLTELTALLNDLRRKYDVTVVFLEAELDVLLRRFKETRRPHPLAGAGGAETGNLAETIAVEKGLLIPIRDQADKIIDTSSFTPHNLREYITGLYGGDTASGRDALNVTLMTFGFKYGIPQNVDLVFDVRFLPNPHFVPELKDLNGHDAPVRDFVLNKPQTAEFIKKLSEMLKFLIPHYKKEGKSYLTVGIGCTGGRHRSVAIAPEIAKLLKKSAININIVHREL